MREEVSWPCGLGVLWSTSEIIPRSPLSFSQSPDIALSPERTVLYGLRKFPKVIHDASTPPALVDDYRSQVTTVTALPISHLTTPTEKQVWKQWVQDKNLSLCKIFIIHKETTLSSTRVVEESCVLIMAAWVFIESSLITQLVKNLPEIQNTPVWFLHRGFYRQFHLLNILTCCDFIKYRATLRPLFHFILSKAPVLQWQR